VVPDGGLPPPADAASAPSSRDAAPPRDAGREAAPVLVDTPPDAAPAVALDGGPVSGDHVDADEPAGPGAGPPGNALQGGIGCNCQLGDRGGPALGPAVLVAAMVVLRRRRRP